jgi:hypothetical protein
MRIDGKNRWLFRLDHETYYNQDIITGFEYDHEWFHIKPNGEIKLKCSPEHDFTWDGCTPKWVILDLIVGTPDGAVYTLSGLRKTQRASLIHDVLYQFAPRDKVTREQVDKLFYIEMKKTNFTWAWVYWKAVRLFGNHWWKKNTRS